MPVYQPGHQAPCPPPPAPDLARYALERDVAVLLSDAHHRAARLATRRGFPADAHAHRLAAAEQCGAAKFAETMLEKFGGAHPMSVEPSAPAGECAR